MAFHPLPTDFIVITMLKVILKTESDENNYVGSWEAFSDRYELDDECGDRPSLVPLTSMN